MLLSPALLLIAGYFAVQVYLRATIRDEEKATGNNLVREGKKTDTLGGKKVSALDLRPHFVERLQQLLKKSSNGLYELTVGDLTVDVLASTIALRNVTVRPDAKQLEALKASGLLPDDVFTFAFKNLHIEGVNLDDAITSKTMDYKLVKLVNPEIEIVHYKAGRTKPECDFTQRFLKEMQKLSLDKLVVQDGNISVHDKQKGTTKRFANVQVLMKDILLNEETRADKSRFLFAKEARLDFHDYSSRTKDGLYNLKIAGVSVNAAQKQITLNKFSFGSPLSKQAFVKKQKQAKEMYGLSIPTVTLTGVDWWSLLNEEDVLATEVEMRGGKFSVYFNRSLPSKKKLGNFPNQLLLKLPFKLDIARIKIRNLDLSYEEYNPLSQQSGTIYFDNASMDITNAGNQNKAPVVVNGTALLMHQVPVRARFEFDMRRAKSGRFSASVHSATPYAGSLLNSFTAPLGMMRVEKGELKKLDATIRGDETGASGTVQVLYNDLKLALLEKDQGKTTLDKKDVTSLLANLVVLKKDNPKGGKTPRVEQGSFQRDPTGGFMMLVWKTILVGVLKSIGAPTKLAYKKQTAAKQ